LRWSATTISRSTASSTPGQKEFVNGRKEHPGWRGPANGGLPQVPNDGRKKMANSLIAHNTGRGKSVCFKTNRCQGSRSGRLSRSSLIHMQEAKWICFPSQGSDCGWACHPSDIIVLVQRKTSWRRAFYERSRKRQFLQSRTMTKVSWISEAAQRRFFRYSSLLLDNERSGLALRYLLGAGTATFRSGPYGKLRTHCESSGDSPWAGR